VKYLNPYFKRNDEPDGATVLTAKPQMSFELEFGNLNLLSCRNSSLLVTGPHYKTLE